MQVRISLLALAIVKASISSAALAQSPAGVTRSSTHSIRSSLATTASAAAQTGGGRYGSFALQALGGTLGSVAGLGIGLAVTDDCNGDDDVVCALEKASITGALGVIAATAGVAIAGRGATERPSIVGSILGGIAGSVVGIGLHHLITEELSQQLGDAGTFALFTISQGTFTAAGGRVGAMIRARR